MYRSINPASKPSMFRERWKNAPSRLPVSSGFVESFSESLIGRGHGKAEKPTAKTQEKGSLSTESEVTVKSYGLWQRRRLTEVCFRFPLITLLTSVVRGGRRCCRGSVRRINGSLPMNQSHSSMIPFRRCRCLNFVLKTAVKASGQPTSGVACNRQNLMFGCRWPRDEWALRLDSMHSSSHSAKNRIFPMQPKYS